MRPGLPTTLVLAAWLCLTGVAHAQDAAWAPASGDTTIDARLADINRYAAQYPEPFTDELVRYFDAPRELVDALVQGGWAPADVYYACVLARSAGRPCRYVTDEWARHPQGGWATLAERLGAAPGTAQFERVRDAFAPSYARWGRPLPAALPAAAAPPGGAPAGRTPHRR